jgi:hypothetical protein
VTDQRRIFSASDLAQFEYCPLAWWYEEVSELAQADQEELAERLQALEAGDASSASAFPEYEVVRRLLERANQFAQGRAQHAADAARHPDQQADQRTIVAPVPRIFPVLVVGLAVLTVVLLGLGLLLWVR